MKLRVLLSVPSYLLLLYVEPETCVVKGRWQVHNQNQQRRTFDTLDGQRTAHKKRLIYEAVLSTDRRVRNIYEYNDCEIAPWSSWEPCSVQCGAGTTYRIRQWLTQHFQSCPEVPLRESKPCHTTACAEENPTDDDCAMDAWGKWSECSVSCGKGQYERKRIRRVKTDKGCDVDTEVETYNCVKISCPRDCGVSQWSDWSQCSVSCGTGVRERRRARISEADRGGKACQDFVFIDRENCKMIECEREQHQPLDSNREKCKSTPWDDWSECSSACGSGIQTRQRELSEFVRDTCETTRTVEEQKCNDDRKCRGPLSDAQYQNSQQYLTPSTALFVALVSLHIFLQQLWHDKRRA